MYVITGHSFNSDFVDISKIKKTNNELGANQLLLQIYSDMNGFKPFVCKDIKPSYREIGYYPNALRYIDNQSLINNQLNDQIEPCSFCISIIIFGGKLHNYMQIQAVFKKN